MNLVILIFLIIFYAELSQAAIIDTRKQQKEGCAVCANIAKERCHTGGKAGALCHKIAHESCPSKLLNSRPPDLAPLSGEDTGEVLEMVKASRQQKQDNQGVFDLLNGILLAVHTSSKADLRRAKEKELKEEIFKKVAMF